MAARRATATAVSAAFAAALMATAPAASADVTPQSAPGGCSDVALVFARGTFEAPGVGATGQSLADALGARLGGRTLTVRPVAYPASLDFQRAAEGVVDARSAVEQISASCPNTKIVLGGYSQGAAVATYTTADSVPDGYVLPTGIDGPLPKPVADHVAAVALFGSPTPSMLSMLDRSAPPLVVGGNFAGKTMQSCAPGDPVCQDGGIDRAAHSAYKSNGMTDQAADYIVSKL
jgi:cutinase